MKVKSEREVAQPCLTLSDPMDGSPPGSPIPGILQARALEWVAILKTYLHSDPSILLLRIIENIHPQNTNKKTFIETSVIINNKCKRMTYPAMEK